MIDHKGSTEEIKAAISRAETLLEDWLWAAAHVQYYSHLIEQANDVPKPDGAMSISEWVAYQQRVDTAREMGNALCDKKEPHRLAAHDAFWKLYELLPAGQPFAICAFGARYHVEVMRNVMIVTLIGWQK